MRKATKVRVGIEKEGWKVIRDLGTATQIGRVEVVVQCLRCGAIRRVRFDNFMGNPPRVCPGCGHVGQQRHSFRNRGATGIVRKRVELPERLAGLREEAKRELSPDEYRRFYAALYGAHTRGLAWELSLDEYRAMRAAACVYCGESGGATGLDRVDNAHGYTASNTVPCCTDCNRMKWAHSREAFLARVRKIAAYVGAAGEPGVDRASERTA